MSGIFPPITAAQPEPEPEPEPEPPPPPPEPFSFEELSLLQDAAAEGAAGETQDAAKAEAEADEEEEEPEPVDLSQYSDDGLGAMAMPELQELCTRAGVPTRRKKQTQLLACLINRRERQRKAVAKEVDDEGGATLATGTPTRRKRRKSGSGMTVKRKVRAAQSLSYYVLGLS